MRNTLGTYTPNYNFYMPSIGEQGWGNLVSNNFEILDTNLNDLQTQITTNLNNLNNLQDQVNVIDTNIGDGTRTLFILLPNTTTNTINSENFEEYASYDNNNVYIASFGSYIIFESIPQPTHSCKLMIISVNGNATISGNIDTYPTTLQSELPPGTSETNIYNNNINFIQNSYEITLEYTANGNNSKFSMNYEDYLNFINKTLPPTISQTNKSYQLSIPHAIAAGGHSNKNGTAGSANNTCNGGGGGVYGNTSYTGGTGCIFGQYAGSSGGNGYGYGSGASAKYRCGLIFIINGNLTITGSITQNGGDGRGNYSGGYGGGASGNRGGGGGGGAPVFIYYTGTYVNNGTINTAGGNGYNDTDNGDGGAGGIKTTKITL